YRFSKFVEKKLKEKNYDYLIIHTIQLGIFLQKFLQKEYLFKYFIDIRDYSIMNIFRRKFEILLKESKANFISSEGFREWLPKNLEYILSHNIDLQDKDITASCEKKVKNNVMISTIGSLRDKEITLKLIEKLKNSSKIDLYFFGHGPISYIIEKIKMKNLIYRGKYKKEEEEIFYKNADIINILLPKNNLNSRTLMPNRFYNSLIFGKIILTAKGTYLGEIVEKYNLGIVIDLDEVSNLEEYIFERLKEFNSIKYNSGRGEMIKKIKDDQEKFKEILYKKIKFDSI
ncbi:MAG: hypothetical protein ACRCZO_13490, partial [Cetobacterium sp.]